MSDTRDGHESEYSTFSALSQHPFVSSAMQYSVRISAAVVKRGTVLKAEAEYHRLPSRAEHYCLMVGGRLAHILTTCEQLEHSILYFSSFSPSPKMKKARITRQAHLLYCVENYIVRTQSLYDRSLKLIDAVFEIYNPTRRISHDLVIGNSHVRRSSIPDALKVLKKILDPYRHDRHTIVHERQFLEDDIRRLEAYTILLTSEGPLPGNIDLLEETRSLAKRVVRDKTREFMRVNHDSFVAMGNLFDHLNKEYETKRELLERLFGKAELAPLGFSDTHR